MPAYLNLKSAIRTEIHAALNETGKYVVTQAATYPPAPAGSTYKRTRNLGRSITKGPVEQKGNTYSIEVGTGKNIPYAIYVEHGTGIYGIKGQPIRPKKGKFLVWKAASGQMIFAKQVSGFPGWHFMEKAVTGKESQAYFKARIEQIIPNIIAKSG